MAARRLATILIQFTIFAGLSNSDKNGCQIVGHCHGIYTGFPTSLLLVLECLTIVPRRSSQLI